MNHPASEINDVVHQRFRLGILTIADETARVEFSFLQEALNLSAGNLSRHLDVLAESGLLEVAKGYVGRRPRTWVTITKAGRKALNEELATLAKLIAEHNSRVADSEGRLSGENP